MSGATEGLVAVTFFKSFGASSKTERPVTLDSLADEIRTTSAERKGALPWLKLARFGDIRTNQNSLRHDANVLAISGIEVDYDDEKIQVDDAIERLTKAGLLSLIYTSPSHSDAKPRWRVLCPTSQELAPDKRKHLVGRINGLFAGTLAAESWTLSQSYYLGSVNQNPAHRVELIDGAHIDALDELDEVWRGPPGTQQSTGTRIGPLDEPALIQAIIDGTSYHEAAVRLLGRWAVNNVPFMEARRRLTDAMETVFPADRDARWNARMADIDRCLQDIYGKEARKRDTKAEQSPPPDDVPPPDGRDGPDDGDSATSEPAGKKRQGQNGRQLHVLTPAECAAQSHREYIVKGLLSRGDHGAIIGLPGSAKSALAPYIGYRTSLGLDVFGRRTRATSVLYLAAEDGTGMTMRIRALHDRMGNSPNFLLQPVPIDLLTIGSPHVADVEKLIELYQPGLVILDTIARAFPGLRENDPDAMGPVVKVARGFSAPCNSAVLSIHHPPKDSVTPRGHSILNGDLDLTLFLEGTGSDPRHVTMGKNRNGPSHSTFTFNLAVHTFSHHDEDGDPITAPVAEPVQGFHRPTSKLNPTERKARDILADVICEQGKPLPHGPGFATDLQGVDETVWRDACENRRLSTAEEPDSRKRAFRRTYAEMLLKRVVGANSGWVWLTHPDGGGQTDRV